MRMHRNGPDRAADAATGPAFFPGGSGGETFFPYNKRGPWDFDTCL